MLANRVFVSAICLGATGTVGQGVLCSNEQRNDQHFRSSVGRDDFIVIGLTLHALLSELGQADQMCYAMFITSGWPFIRPQWVRSLVKLSRVDGMRIPGV
jgi:hypothetical protein